PAAASPRRPGWGTPPDPWPRWGTPPDPRGARSSRPPGARPRARDRGDPRPCRSGGAGRARRWTLPCRRPCRGRPAAPGRPPDPQGSEGLPAPQGRAVTPARVGGTPKPPRERLVELLRERSFERKRVILASGRESDFFIDCKQAVLTAEGHALV